MLMIKWWTYLETACMVEFQMPGRQLGKSKIIFVDNTANNR